MKKIIYYFALALLWGPLLTAADTIKKPAVSTAGSLISGQQWYKKIESNYAQGRYETFFSTLSGWYQHGLVRGDLNPLIDIQKELTKQFNTPEGKKLFERLQAKGKKYEEELLQLKKERDQALEEVAHAYPDASISHLIFTRIRNPSLDQEQLKNIEYFEEWLSPFPLHSSTPLLEQLKSLAFEFKVKEILLSTYVDSDENNSKTVLGKIEKKNLNEYRVALTIEKLNKMAALAKKTEEKDIVNVISNVITAYPLLCAEIYNNQAIEESAKALTDEAEKKAYAVLQTFRNKHLALLKKYKFE